MTITGMVRHAKRINGLLFPIDDLQLSDRFPTVIPAMTSMSSAIDIMEPDSVELMPTQSVIKTIKYVDIKLYAAPWPMYPRE